jgi:hypothetical protein
MGAINAFGALGGFAGAYVVGLLGGGTSSGGAFIFMAAALFGAALLMLFVRRPRAAVSQTNGGEPLVEPTSWGPSGRIPTHVGALSVPRSALHSGRMKTH